MKTLKTTLHLKLRVKPNKDTNLNLKNCSRQNFRVMSTRRFNPLQTLRFKML
jgi:hypothetical protein